MLQEALPLFRRLVAGLSSRWSAFDPSPIHVGLVKDEVTVVQDPPPQVLLIHLVSITAPMLHTHFYLNLQTKLWSVWCLRFSQSRCWRFASSGIWTLRRWASDSRRFEGSSSLLGLTTTGTLTASSWLVATFSACIYTNASLCTSGQAVVALCSSQRGCSSKEYLTQCDYRHIFTHSLCFWTC